MAKQLDWNFFVNPMVQVVTILVVSFTLYWMSAHYLADVHVFDPLPDFKQAGVDDQRVKIKTGLFINNFLDFDLTKNDFEVLGTVWFEFNKKEVGLDVLEQSVFSKGKLTQHANLFGDAKPIVTENQGVICAQYPVRINFTSNLNYKLFPFDSHRVYMTLNNMHLDHSKFEFQVNQDDFMVSQNATTYGWSNVGKNVHSGYALKHISNDKKASYPRVIYALDFIRNSFKDVLLLLFPLLVAFFMSIFSFSYDHRLDRENILEIGVATVGAMVGYRFVINASSPKVPYFMLVDWLFTLFLILGFVVFLLNAFNLFKNYRGLAILTLHAILIGSWYSFLYIWG
jgi:hypothetical protein